ncbi:MAG: cytosine deaminase-like metal-dependent hydrolase [Herbaspirillum sp.]|nr:cytosine deaminase-like metal-dependent hydrolase [Herbaspirillum sp.]
MSTAGFVTIPDHASVRLRRAHVPASLLQTDAALPIDAEGLAAVDLEIVNGRIAAIAPAGAFEAASAVDLAGGQVWPTFADLHTHLDKGHVWPRANNPDGSFPSALAASIADRAAGHWTVDDIRRRFEFGLRCAYAHGTGAIRTHLESYQGGARNSWGVFRQLREEWAGRIDLQATSIVPMDVFGTGYGVELADLVQQSGGQLGCVTRVSSDRHGAVLPEFQMLLDRIFELAEQRGLDLDLHVDESGDTGARALGYVARTALARGFKGKILCGHCCSLAIQSDEVIADTLNVCAEAGLAVVSLPMCNMYLQDRTPQRTPRWRGVTLLHEMAAHGIPVSVASDNCRDPFYAYGDHDMLEVFTQAVRIAHLDRPYGDWPKAATATPASVMKLAGRGTIAVGAAADLVLFRGRGMTELLSRRQSDRVVLRNGRAVDTTLPDYRDLDDLVVKTP